MLKRLPIRAAVPWILAALFVALCTWIVLSSESFQSCIRAPPNESGQQDLVEGIAAFFVSVINRYRLCTGEFVDANGESIIAAFTVILAISTIALWSATDKLWQAGEKQMRLIEANATQQSIDMQASTKAAQDAVAVTREIGEAQSRAYISVADFDIKITKIVGERDACISVKITFKNTGRTPARNVQVNYGWAAEPLPFKEEWHITAIEIHEGRGAIGAGVPFSADIRTDQAKNDPDRSLTAAQIADVVRQVTKFWVFGLIEYNDIFGHDRRTRFRYQMNTELGVPGFSPCLVGNEED